MSISIAISGALLKYFGASSATGQDEPLLIWPLTFSHLADGFIHFSYESHDEPFSDALRKLEVGFFNVVVDAAMSAITERCSTFENVGNKFRVLTNFPSLADEKLAEQCNALGTTLHYEGHSDLDSRSLCRSPAIKNHEPPWAYHFYAW